jgi:hypothetical protein
MIATFKYDVFTYEVDDKVDLATMKAKMPLFFKTKFMDKEKYTVYRGVLIVSGEVTFSDRITRKKFVPYLIHQQEAKMDSHCLFSAHEWKSMDEVKAMVDKIWESLDVSGATYQG